MFKIKYATDVVDDHVHFFLLILFVKNTGKLVYSNAFTVKNYRIVTISRNCDFISHNSDFISRNCEIKVTMIIFFLMSGGNKLQYISEKYYTNKNLEQPEKICTPFYKLGM